MNLFIKTLASLRVDMHTDLVKIGSSNIEFASSVLRGDFTKERLVADMSKK